MTAFDTAVEGVHDGAAVATRGEELETADAAVVALHGRGATPAGILSMADELAVDGVAYLAPEAAGREWYPRSFTDPIETNEPNLSSALALVGRVVEQASAAVGRERVVLLGFSQGACLAAEWVARNPDRYGGLVVLSGGVIGAELRGYDGSLAPDGDPTPVFLGCSDHDPYISLERVHETRDVFESLEGAVDERIYEDMGHAINADEIGAARGIVTALTA